MPSVKTLLACLAVGLLVALLMNCGSTSSGGKSEKNVVYEVRGYDIYNNADDSRDWTDHIRGTDYRELTWYCGNYKGFVRHKVILRFKKANDTWMLDQEEMKEGNCN
jgi:hypothetical protein